MPSHKTTKASSHRLISAPRPSMGMNTGAQTHNGVRSYQSNFRKMGSGGLPSRLQSGLEKLSGLAMNDVRVHYNSNKPAHYGAEAFARGRDIFLGRGQERHLAHEAWHVVQQKQGRVRPTTKVKGAAVNDDAKLESEATSMGNRALSLGTRLASSSHSQQARPVRRPIIQRAVGKNKRHSYITRHRKKHRKPWSHRDMDKRFVKVDMTQALTYATLNQLSTLDRKLEKIQKKYGFSTHNSWTVRKATDEGLAGNHKDFARLWRDAHDGMDEHVSTVSVFRILENMGQQKIKAAQKSIVYELSSIMSRFRLPTAFSGYHYKDGSEAVQHPTSASARTFTRRGKGHGYWDRMRREDVLKMIEEKKNILDVVYRAAAHTLNYGVAPAMASNMKHGYTKKEAEHQTRLREMIKEMMYAVKSTPKKVIKVQKPTAPWKPDRDRRSPSPSRF